MILVGSISNEEERVELEYITKIYLIGQRAQELSKKARRQNENNNKK